MLLICSGDGVHTFLGGNQAQSFSVLNLITQILHFMISATQPVKTVSSVAPDELGLVLETQIFNRKPALQTWAAEFTRQLQSNEKIFLVT